MLKCDLHDYLEIICMFHYEVKVISKNDEITRGVAEDVLLSDNRIEVLRLRTAERNITEIGTEDIKEIQVVTPNARFQTIRF